MDPLFFMVLVWLAMLLVCTPSTVAGIYKFYFNVIYKFDLLCICEYDAQDDFRLNLAAFPCLTEGGHARRTKRQFGFSGGVNAVRPITVRINTSNHKFTKKYHIGVFTEYFLNIYSDNVNLHFYPQGALLSVTSSNRRPYRPNIIYGPRPTRRRCLHYDRYRRCIYWSRY